MLAFFMLMVDLFGSFLQPAWLDFLLCIENRQHPLGWLELWIFPKIINDDFGIPHMVLLSLNTMSNKIVMALIAIISISNTILEFNICTTQQLSNKKK